MVLDRWNWLKRRLPRTESGERLLDVGCGSGAFTIGAALRGYESLGLSWDERNQRVAAERAVLCGAPSARFEVQDVRRIDERTDLAGRFDVVICLEVIEHILDDGRLMRLLAGCIRPGGRLLLTTPYVNYVPITPNEAGPWHTVENGWHVRKGYDEPQLRGLCEQAGLVLQASSYCGGYMSQKVCWVQWMVSRIHPMVAWGAILPLRVLPPLLDSALESWTSWPSYSICIEAQKPATA
ncbi:MAG: class I SAM-dependent methyltransferase [Candidatus Polarisedimenticolia bacterium]